MSVSSCHVERCMVKQRQFYHPFSQAHFCTMQIHDQVKEILTTWKFLEQLASIFLRLTAQTWHDCPLCAFFSSHAYVYSNNFIELMHLRLILVGKEAETRRKYVSKYIICKIIVDETETKHIPVISIDIAGHPSNSALLWCFSYHQLANGGCHPYKFC